MLQERRKARSDVEQVAAQLYLRVATQRSNLAGFVLADDSGLVIAAQTKGAAAETLAAFAPLGSANQHCAEALSVPADSVHVHSFDLLGQRCHLSAVGPARPNMRDAAQAMGRIFSEAA